jgi:hypothetical protein
MHYEKSSRSILNKQTSIIVLVSVIYRSFCHFVHALKSQMSSAMSITNSKNDHHDTGPSITIMVADDDSTVMQALTGGAMQQQHVPHLSPAADISEIIIEEGPQETTGTPSEVTEGVTVEAQSSAVGESQDGKPQRIRIHPKLYKAAVEGNVDFLHSDGKPLIKQFD